MKPSENQMLLDGRLAAAASFVRDGAVFADIGTDHAYLPIALLQSGRISSALAADTAREPLSRAEKHIAACGLSSAIETVLTDGLSGLGDRHLTDIAVCGMGGELIARIIGDAPFVKDPGIRLILQPMTMQPVLRRYLAASGFAFAEETIAAAGGKLYPVLCCVYSGETAVLSPTEALIGPYIIGHRREIPLFVPYAEQQIRRLTVIADGRASAGADAAEERQIIRDLHQLIQTL